MRYHRLIDTLEALEPQLEGDFDPILNHTFILLEAVHDQVNITLTQ